MNIDPVTCLTLLLGCVAIVPILGAIVCSGYVYQIQRAQIRLLQEEKDNLARRLKETQQAANMPTVFLMGSEPATILPETVAHLQQLTERLAQMQAIPSLPLMPSVRFVADEYLNLATGYYALRQFQLAIENYDRFLRLVENPAAFNNRGAAYAELGQYERAIQDYDKALQLKPDYPMALVNRGLAYAELGQRERAIQDYDKALDIKPDYPEALNNRGVTYMHLGHYERAIQDIDRALQLSPDDPASRYNMACLYSLMNKSDEALKWLKEAIDLDAKCRDDAKSDPDFDNIRDDPRFKELVGE